MARAGFLFLTGLIAYFRSGNRLTFAMQLMMHMCDVFFFSLRAAVSWPRRADFINEIFAARLEAPSARRIGRSHSLSG